MNVVKPKYKADLYKRTSVDDMKPGTREDASYWFKNTGNVPWYSEKGLKYASSNTNAVILQTAHPVGDRSPLGSLWGSNRNTPTRKFAAVYKSNGKTLTSNQHIVNPGEIVKFDFTFVVNTNYKEYGKHTTYFTPRLMGNSKAFSDPNAYIHVNVIK